jgi:DNA-binding transcriptional LysR family regulator
VRENIRHRYATERAQFEALDLNLRSLDIFIQIAESGAMSTTARRMGLTQSAVSQMIANLETSIGVQLFDRRIRPIALTPAGLVLLNKARPLLLEARSVIKAAREPAAEAFPKLNLCLIETIAGTIGPELVCSIQNFAAFWSVHAGLYSHPNRALLSREVDIVLTPDALEDEPHVERHEILRELYFIAAPKTFNGGETLAALVEGLDLIRFSPRTMLGRQTERHLRRLRVNAKGRVEFDNAEAVITMVANGLGWAIVTPLCALLGQSLWTKMRFLPMPGPTLHRRLHLIARQGELGDIPLKVALEAAKCVGRVISDQFLHWPWIVAGCRVANPAALTGSELLRQSGCA